MTRIAFLLGLLLVMALFTPDVEGWRRRRRRRGELGSGADSTEDGVDLKDVM